MNTAKEALIISGVGLAVTGYVGPKLWRAVSSRHWQPVAGTIVETVIEHIGDADSKLRHQLRVRYTYSVKGEVFTGDRLNFFAVTVPHATRASAQAHLQRISRGQTIDLWYDPADPTQAVPDREIPWALWLALAVGVIFLAGGALPILLGRTNG